MLQKLKQRLAMALVAIVAFTGVIVATEQPAMAAGSCYSGYLCLYENIGYSGSEYDLSSGFRGSCVTLYGFWHDRVSSFQNYIGADITFYRNAYCDSSNGWFWNGNGDTSGDLRSWGWNDTIDSVWIN